MKSILVSFAAFNIFSAPAQAQYVILPHLYAEKYCILRYAGASYEDAIKAAISESMVTGTRNNVTINGKVYGTDIIEATNAVQRKCPERMRP
jgi:hypothetical protein